MLCATAGEPSCVYGHCVHDQCACWPLVEGERCERGIQFTLPQQYTSVCWLCGSILSLLWIGPHASSVQRCAVLCSAVFRGQYLHQCKIKCNHTAFTQEWPTTFFGISWLIKPVRMSKHVLGGFRMRRFRIWAQNQCNSLPGSHTDSSQSD